MWLHKQPGRMCRIHTGEDIGRGGKREEWMEARGRLTVVFCKAFHFTWEETVFSGLL